MPDITPNVQADADVERGAILKIIEHFNAAEGITNSVLLEYCNLEHLPIMTEGEYADWLFAYKFDKRLSEFIPALFVILSKYQNVPELAGEDKRKAITKANEDLSVEVCKLMEDHGVLYQEIELVTKNIASNLSAIMLSAGVRANNMAAELFAFLASEKLGKPLVLKTIGEEFRKTVLKEGGEVK